MAFIKRLTLVFAIIYVLVFLYLFLFIFVQPVQEFIIEIRQSVAGLTEGDTYYWALIISFLICFLGSASVGFPIPFPFVLFSLSNSIFLRLSDLGFTAREIAFHPEFWLQISGIAIIGGLGAALGELTGYIIGFGAKKIAESRRSDVLQNIDGFGKVILKNQKRTPLYVFLFVLTPLPDDILFLPLGMIKYPFWKCIIPGWLGKNITTFFYCTWPLLFQLGLIFGGLEANDFTNVVTEAILLLFTITIMFFIMGFDWGRYLEERTKKKEQN
jgi:membrane protein YqaA with SNARE-associated domain